MVKLLYGDLAIKERIDRILVPLKIIYIIYTIPFLLMTAIMFIRGLGAFKGPANEKIGKIKRVLLHCAAIFWSFCLWVIILSSIKDALK